MSEFFLNLMVDWQTLYPPGPTHSMHPSVQLAALLLGKTGDAIYQFFACQWWTLSSADNLCKQFGAKTGQQNLWLDLDPICLIMRWYS